MKRIFVIYAMICLFGLAISLLNATEVSIGAGDQQARIPVDFYYKNSLFETVYLASELNIAGLLTGVHFINNFVYDLPDMPTKIWIGETTESDLASGWIPSSQLTQVFDGNVDYPTGINDINIEFQTPYAYNGGNLVMMVKRPWDVVYYNYANSFQAQSGNIPARTRNVYSDTIDYDPAAPPADTPEATFPRTAFVFDTQGLGALQGTVTSAGSPVSGATVSISGTGFTTLTAANGNYSFPYVNAGTYTVQATKHGYNLVEQNVTIVEAQTATQDFALIPLTQVTVSGHIVDLYNPANSLNGATISLSGYESYTAEADANGLFSIPNVYANHTYQYLVQCAGYADASGEVIVANDNVDMGSICLIWIAPPPRNVDATEADNNNYVVIDWDAPAGNPDMVAYKVWRFLVADQNNEANWTMLTPNVIIDPILYDNSWYLLPQGVYKYAVKAYYINSAVSEPAFSNEIPKGMTGSLAGIVFDLGSGGLLAGVEITAGTCSGTSNAQGAYSLEVYQGTYTVYATKTGYSPWTQDNVVIQGLQTTTLNITMQELCNPPNTVLASVNGSNNIVNISWNAPGTSLQAVKVWPACDGDLDTPETKHERTLLGYKVWRLIQGQEANEALWTLITPGTITATAYQDLAWGSLPNANYKWVVKAVYSGNNLSAPAFSNCIVEIPQSGTISGIARNLQNDPIMGATVSCGTVTATTDASGSYTMDVASGTHSVTASHPNYEAVTHNGVVVNTGQTTTVNFQLNYATLLVDDSFESYPDFATVFAPWTTIDVDQSSTYDISGVTWPGSGNAIPFMIFNPSATIPPITTIPPHTGNKLAVAIASIDPPNNDWLITPIVHNPYHLEFWARSFNNQYGLEQFRVGVSTTNTAPASFNIISGAGYIQAPMEWTAYHYDLDNYNGYIYVGIQCVSFDASILMVDDVRIWAEEPSITTQSIPLNSGWNLVSLNVSPDNHNITRLITSLGNNVIQIKGTEGVYMPDNPFSTLYSFTNGRAYYIKMNSSATWNITGYPIHTNTPLALVDGWNMTAYLPQSPLPVANAISSISSWLVQLKGTDGVYTPGDPYSTLTTMYPGKGYWMKLNGAHNLVYPGTSSAGLSTQNTDAVVTSACETPTQNHGTLAPLSSSMTVLAKCTSASAGDLLLATVNGELRGQELLIAPEGFAAAMIQVYTECSNEEISFCIQKPDGGTIPLATKLYSEPNGILGAYPEFISLEPMPVDGEVPLTTVTGLEMCYPNPFHGSTSISLNVEKDNSPVKLEIYNLKGQKVKTLFQGQLPAGNQHISWNGDNDNGQQVASGIYFCRLSSATRTQNIKLMILK